MNRKERIIGFLDYMFSRVGAEGAAKTGSRILFPQTGAQPLAEMAKVYARIKGNGWDGRMHSIWANMRNNDVMQLDPEQAVLFVKYLYDQGVLGAETKRIWVVDTDSRNPILGTEQIFYRTLMNEEVIKAVNQRFNLNLPVWNANQGYDLRVIYVYLPSFPINFARNNLDERDYYLRMKVEGFNESGYPGSDLSGFFWKDIDEISPLNSIEDRFVLKDGIVVPVKKEPYGLSLSGVSLHIDHHLRYAGLMTGMLSVLEARGFVVQREMDNYIANLHFRLMHLTDQDNVQDGVVQPSIPLAEAWDEDNAMTSERKYTNKNIYNQLSVPASAGQFVKDNFFSFRDYVHEVLYNPSWGYYGKGRVSIAKALAKGVDFVTLPEDLSLHYGQMMAEHAFGIWKSMGGGRISLWTI